MIVVIDNVSGEIQTAYHGDEPRPEGYVGYLGDLTQVSHVLIPKGIDAQVMMTAKDANGRWKIVVDPEKQKAQDRMAWAFTREQRDKRLRETDFMLLPDVPLSARALAEIKVYRQALRDITKKYKTPDKVRWPRKPVETPDDVMA